MYIKYDVSQCDMKSNELHLTAHKEIHIELSDSSTIHSKSLQSNTFTFMIIPDKC